MNFVTDVLRALPGDRPALVSISAEGERTEWSRDECDRRSAAMSAALASAVMGLPLMVRAIRLAIEAVDRRYEQAAATLGARPVVIFFSVTLPLAAPGIVAGAVLCFAKALGEFGATITFVSAIPGETQTLAAALYALTQTPGADAAAWRLTLVAVAVSIAALIASEWLARRVAQQVRGGT
jgi:molybdate transport system permease protein